MADAINIGSIIADLGVDSSKLERGLALGRRAMNTFESELRQLNQDFNAGLISLTDYNNRVVALTASMNSLAAAMQGGYSRAQNLGSGLEIVNAGLAAGKNRSAQFGMAMMQAGSAIDDVQYGFKGVVNNIGPFVYSITAAAGASTGAAFSIGAAAQVIAVAGFQAYEHWGQLMDLMGIGKVRTEAEEMAELGKNTSRTADETARLNKYKKEQHEIEELLKKDSKEGADRKKDITEAYAGFGDEKGTGFEKVAGGLAQAIASEGGESMTEEEKKQIEGAERAVKEKGASAIVGHRKSRKKGFLESFFLDEDERAGITAQQRLDELKGMAQERINTANAEAAKKLANGATNNGDDAKAMIAKVKRNPSAFPPGLLKDLEDNLPENRKQQATFEAQGKANDNKAKADIQKRKDEEKRVDEEDDYEEAMLQDSIRRNRAARQKREQLQKKQVIEGKASVAGADEFAKNAILSSSIKGNDGDVQAARKAIFKALIGKNFTEEGAGKITDEIFKDADKDVKNSVMGKIASGDFGDDEEQKRARNAKSEQFSAADLAAKVQGGVSGGEKEQKKQTNLQEQMKNHLAKLVAMNGGNPWSQVVINN